MIKDEFEDQNKIENYYHYDLDNNTESKYYQENYDHLHNSKEHPIDKSFLPQNELLGTCKIFGHKDFHAIQETEIQDLFEASSQVEGDISKDVFSKKFMTSNSSTHFNRSDRDTLTTQNSINGSDPSIQIFF